MYPESAKCMLSAHVKNTEEQIMNTELIIPIIQQATVVMVAVALLYGLQQMIDDFPNDQVEALEKARSLRRQAYQRSLEVLTCFNPEHMPLTTSQYGHSVKGARIEERSQSKLANVQVSRPTSKYLMVEISSETGMLASKFELGSSD